MGRRKKPAAPAPPPRSSDEIEVLTGLLDDAEAMLAEARRGGNTAAVASLARQRAELARDLQRALAAAASAPGATFDLSSGEAVAAVLQWLAHYATDEDVAAAMLVLEGRDWHARELSNPPNPLPPALRRRCATVLAEVLGAAVRDRPPVGMRYVGTGPALVDQFARHVLNEVSYQLREEGAGTSNPDDDVREIEHYVRTAPPPIAEAVRRALAARTTPTPTMEH